ncbi:MAG: hypothetical protein ABI415_00165 [Flavitalea sp.]
MRPLLLISCLILLLGCTTAYKSLQPATGNVNDILKFKPIFTTALYKTEVNVAGRYLSGLLMLKKMADSSTRILFSTETGFKFFDFGILNDGSFKVYYVIKQMNKKPVIKTLRKDFEWILMQPLKTSNVIIRKDEQFIYYIFPQSKGFNTYITNIAGNELVRMERSSKRKPVAEAINKDYRNGLPDSIGISHKNFNFSIGLKRVEQ